MSYYFKIDENNVIISKMTHFGIAFNSDGWLVGNPTIGASHYINGEFLTQPNKPSIAHEWDSVGFTWQITLNGLNLLRAKCIEGINTARDNEEQSGFPAYGRLFDSNTRSVLRINSAVQTAQAIGSTFSVEWTCADNSTITLDSSQMQALPVYLAQFSEGLHAKAKLLKEQINNAATLEEVEAVTW